MFLLIIHRWAGLTIAFALVITGVTGAILPYQHMLSDWLAPEVWHVEKPSPSATPISGLELARHAQAETGGIVSYIPLAPNVERARTLFISPAQEGPALDYNVVLVDPYSGDIRARLKYGDLSEGAVSWMPFLASFHYTLAAGETGQLIMGIAALIWLALSVIGFILSLPRFKGGWRGIVKGFRAAATVRKNSGSIVLTHDIHRAVGLWIWPIMLVFAWSAVAFTLSPLHASVQKFFGAEGLYRPVSNPAPAVGTPMSWEQAVTHGHQLMQIEANRGGFTVRAPEALSVASYANAYGYYARTSLDEPSVHGSTVVWFDQVSGALLGFGRPFGSTGADAVDKTVRILHTADGLGWPYRIFVSVFGLLTAGMAAAGVLLWFRRSRRAPPIASAAS